MYIFIINNFKKFLSNILLNPSTFSKIGLILLSNDSFKSLICSKAILILFKFVLVILEILLYPNFSSKYNKESHWNSEKNVLSGFSGFSVLSLEEGPLTNKENSSSVTILLYFKIFISIKKLNNVL